MYRNWQPFRFGENEVSLILLFVKWFTHIHAFRDECHQQASKKNRKIANKESCFLSVQNGVRVCVFLVYFCAPCIVSPKHGILIGRTLFCVCFYWWCCCSFGRCWLLALFFSISTESCFKCHHISQSPKSTDYCVCVCFIFDHSIPPLLAMSMYVLFLSTFRIVLFLFIRWHCFYFVRSSDYIH